MLEYLGAVHALKRGRQEWQLDRVRLSERGVRPQPPAGAMEQHVGEVRAESSAGQEAAGAAADLEDSVARPRRSARPDPAHTLALDPADEHARVVVEAIEVVLADHCVVPRLDLGAVSEPPGCHTDYAITGRAYAEEIMPTGPDGDAAGARR
jgi:hypothetical protein